MTPAEVLHRIREQAKVAGGKWTKPPSVAPHTNWPEGSPLRDHAMRLAGYPGAKTSQEAALFAFQTRTLTLLGTTWPTYETFPDWHFDPITARRWPRDYAFSVKFRNNPTLGDVKYVWELNRLQFLLPVAIAAAESSDRELARSCDLCIENWIDENPIGQGVQWATSIEVALRAIVIVCVRELTRDLHPSNRVDSVIMTFLSQAIYWIDRFPSKHSSSNNHRIAELSAICILGLRFPTMVAPDKLSQSLSELHDEGVKQIHADGIGSEQSPTYTAFTLEWISLVRSVANAAGKNLDPDLDERITKGAHALRWFLDCKGNHIRIGDDDEGRVISSFVPSRFFVDAVAGEVLGQRMTDPPTGIRIFPRGGYTVLRDSGQAGREILLAFDHGPLGHGRLAAHGHADALSVWLHRDGVPVLVDAGTYTYHDDPSWRAYFRSSRAHNTLVLDGTESSRMSGAFNWEQRNRGHGRLLNFRSGAGTFLSAAEHRGYQGTHAATHQRQLEQLAPGFFRILDRLVGTSRPLPVTISFLINPALVVDRGDESWDVRSQDGVVVLRISPEEQVGVSSVLRGSDSPIGGWCSPNFGKRVPATQIIYSMTLGPGEWSSILLDVGGTSGETETRNSAGP